MKKLRIVILVACSVFVGFSAFYIIKAAGYKKHIRFMQEEVQWNRYQRGYVEYKMQFGSYPRSFDDIMDYQTKLVAWPIKYEACREFESGEDYLSREGGYIEYYPLYNSVTKEIESFILLSAGIDGKFNNKLSPQDTLFSNSWWTKLAVYNYDEAALMEDYKTKSRELLKIYDVETARRLSPPYPKMNNKFSLYDYYFGTKDYIVQIGEEIEIIIQ